MSNYEGLNLNFTKTAHLLMDGDIESNAKPTKIITSLHLDVRRKLKYLKKHQKSLIFVTALLLSLLIMLRMGYWYYRCDCCGSLSASTKAVCFIVVSTVLTTWWNIFKCDGVNTDIISNFIFDEEIVLWGIIMVLSGIIYYERERFDNDCYRSSV